MFPKKLQGVSFETDLTMKYKLAQIGIFQKCRPGSYTPTKGSHDMPVNKKSVTFSNKLNASLGSVAFQSPPYCLFCMEKKKKSTGLEFSSRA